jgi:hypothetical protein
LIGSRAAAGFAASWGAAVAWALLIALLWTVDLLTKLTEAGGGDHAKALDRLIAEQATSALAALIMVAFVVRWLRLFPLEGGRWPITLLGHLAGSVFFTFGHYLLMVIMRWAWYTLNQQYYLWRDSFADNLLLEYQKDIKIYLGMVAVIVAYRFVRGAHKPAALAEAMSPLSPEEPDRLMVQTGRGVRVLPFSQIERLWAAKNYVVVYAEGREHLVRETLSGLLARIQHGPFLRTHRSYIVNVERIVELRTGPQGTKVVLTSGAEVPLSRSYRDELERRLQYRLS